MTHAREPPSVILLCLLPTVHDQEPSQAPGLCGSTEWGRCHQTAPILQGDRLGTAGAEENQAPLQAENCKWGSQPFPSMISWHLCTSLCGPRAAWGVAGSSGKSHPQRESEALDVDCHKYETCSMVLLSQALFIYFDQSW